MPATTIADEMRRRVKNAEAREAKLKAKRKPATVTITPAELESLESVYGRADDDWATYFSSGHGPSDFGSIQEWRAYVTEQTTDLRRVRALIRRVVRAAKGGTNA